MTRAAAVRRATPAPRPRRPGARFIAGTGCRSWRGAFVACFFALGGNGAHAADVSVLSAGAVEPGLRAAIASWGKETGNSASVAFNAAPQIAQRLEAGERFDVVIAPSAIADRFRNSGALLGDPVSVGGVGVGVAVRPGAPVPDVSTVDGLRKSLREAESIVFNRASTGVYVEALLKKLGLYDELLPRITRVTDGAAVMEHLLRGSGREIGLGAITEILLYRDKGLRFAGPLPSDVQNVTVYVATVHRDRAHPDAAQAFVRYLGTPAVRAIFDGAGIR